MHVNYYGSKAEVTFDLMSHIEANKRVPEFEPIKVPEGYDENWIASELNAAENTLISYKEMLLNMKKADAASDNVSCGTREYDHMTEEDETIYDDCSMDIISTMVHHLRIQVSKFTKYCSDLEDELEDISNYQREVSAYGTYEDQVRNMFNTTR